MFSNYNLIDDLFNMRTAFDRFFGDSLWGRTSYPPVNIYEGEDRIELKALLPGVNKDDVTIGFENGVLTLQGKCNPDRTEGTQFLREECHSGEFRKAIRINAAVKADSISAHLEDGVLTVTMSKQEEAKPRKIEVK